MSLQEDRQRDVLNRLIMSMLHRSCHCGAQVEPSKQCVRCRLMWDTKTAFPAEFAVATDLFTLAFSGERAKWRNEP